MKTPLLYLASYGRKIRLKTFSLALMILVTGILSALSVSAPLGAAAPPGNQQTDLALEQFKQAWQAARRGDRAKFESIKADLVDYVLFPYLQYEDYRSRLDSVTSSDISAFLQAHPDWAFTAGLRKAWLIALGKGGKWDELLLYGQQESNVDIQCYTAQAAIHRLPASEAIPRAQALWAVGKSQPDACDPVFDWLRKQGGITYELAWLRVNRAMEARNSRLTLYLARFVSPADKVWLERWQQQDREGYLRLSQARKWPDQVQAREITAFGLKQLARKDADRAWNQYEVLKGSIDWGAEREAGILADLALWSAVANLPETLSRMQLVPESARNDKLLEWWARAGLAEGNWAEVILAVAAMSDEFKADERWIYWDARARLKLGDADYGLQLLENLSTEATYYGFLAADALDKPYSICEQHVDISARALAAFRQTPIIQRVTALQQAGLEQWSRSEWNLNVRNMNEGDRRLAAALATEEHHPNLAILALTSREDRTLYDWRFPLHFAPQVEQQARKQKLDVAWVLGLMRAESAMATDAVSSANARGLMQVLPGTAAQIAKRRGYAYRGSEQLMQAEDNILFGTTFLRELMDKFDNNQVLVTGAYNAGPGAAKRWRENLPGQDAAVWIEILPFYETRDYIPRVLAFATIYDWRMQQPVQRISSRMPPPDSGTISAGPAVASIAGVACTGKIPTVLPGS